MLVVHEGAARPWTVAVLAALGDRIDRERSGFVAAADLAAAPARDVFLVDGAVLPADARRPGAWIFLAPLAGALPFDVGPVLEEPLLWRTDAEHPLLDGLDLSTVFAARAQPIVAEDARGIAFAEDRVVLAEGERDGVRWIALGLDPTASDLPVRAALPLLVRNAIARLAAHPLAPLPPVVASGDALRPSAPLPGGADVHVRWGGRTTRARVAADGETWTVPPGAHGPAEIVGADGTVRARTGFAAFRPGAPLAPVRPPAAAPPPAPPREDPASAWRRSLLAAALLLLVLDLALLRPRRARAPSRARGVELAPLRAAP
jgi:hypothetical protein